MIVNPTTLTFADLTDTEANELLAQVEAIILTGTVPLRTNKFVQAWTELAAAQGHNLQPHNWLLTMSVVYPQRALLSLVWRMKGEVR